MDRTVRQYLQSLQRAGVTHLPKVHVATETSKPAPETPAKATPPAAANPTAETSSMPPSEPAPASVDRPPLVPPGADPQQRADALQALAACVADCTRCPELAQSRRQTVFGVGNPDARIMFVGEAPGADEDRLGEPFVGAAGKLLNKIIQACRLERGDIYICNILRCRPPGNRNPTPVEAENCREYLDGQIAIVQPEYIVCWGSVAARNLLNLTSPVSRMRGRFFEHGTARVLVTYHPSYLLRNASAKKLVWDDMKFLFADMGVTLK